MSDSRLEKFIYAICSMDVSDLPVPLSRIEKLWNCLITGETPDFEPLSRNEKYLMAMLDRYDISNLPAPMSRGEKLLYKIAVGETDLSDVPGYLSRYEELLKYLIENGGISGGDFEYVLYTINQSMYTLYNTAEKPVKRAILKGHTLVNLEQSKHSIDEYKKYTIVKKLAENKRYIAIFPYLNNAKYAVFNMKTQVFIVEYTTSNKLIFTTPSSPFEIRLYVNIEDKSYNLPEEAMDILCIEYQEGMENWDIPYFEGMQSVKLPVLKTTGKNLFDSSKWISGRPAPYVNSSINQIENTGNSATPIIECKPNTTYTISRILPDNSTTNWYALYGYNKDGLKVQNIVDTEQVGNRKFTTNNDVYYLRGKSNNLYEIGKNELWQIEEGSTTTSYEPYKSNILTTPEEVVLRSLPNGVCDTLNVETGEYVQRIGETFFDGSDDEGWIFHGLEPSGKYCYKSSYTMDVSVGNSDGYCDKLIYVNGGEEPWNKKLNCISILNTKWLTTYTEHETLDSYKQWLSQNPLTIQYELATPVVKTVDLTTVNQDNQPTRLGTFENVTHVSLKSAGLIPTLEMEVATNLLEDTVFTLTNAFNTLYPTAAKPVVDGTLYGQTLVNLATQKSGRFNGTRFLRIPLSYTLNSNRNYFVNFVIKESTLTYGVTCRFKNTSTGATIGAIKSSGIIATNANVADILEIYIDNTDDVTNGLDATIDDIMVIEYRDGMENWDIPYFEGMQSVQAPGVTMTGKNLLHSEVQVFNLNNYIRIGNDISTPCDTELRPSTTYTLSWNGNNRDGKLRLYSNGVQTNAIDIKWWASSITFTTSETENGFAFYTQLVNDNSLTSDMSFNVQLEEGSTVTPYEPHKSITLSTPEDLELRGIGNVKDELNVATGELTQRVEEFRCEVKRVAVQGTNMNGNTRFLVELINPCPTFKDVLFNNHNFIYNPNTSFNYGDNGEFYFNRPTEIFLTFNPSKYTADTLKTYLEENPLILIIQLAQESVKTVDLTTVNQDGNETKLRTFDDTTHVLLQSEAGPNPGASLTVRTKIPSGSSTSLLMDDISNNQQQLNTTVSEQSNNVDATMIATTEIYEETL